MRSGRAKLGFLLFWAAACAAWTLMWLLLNSLLVPDPLRVAPRGLVGIGLATAMLPVVVLWVGRTLLFLAARGLSFARHRAAKLRPPASRSSVGRTAEAEPRRAPAPLGEEYQSSAGPL